MRTVPSSPALTISFPSGLKAADQTDPVGRPACAPLRRWRHPRCAPCRRHRHSRSLAIRAVGGRPDPIRVAFQRAHLCAAGGIPDAHRAVATGPTISVPSGLKAADQTNPCGLPAAHRCAAGGIPDAHRAVVPAHTICFPIRAVGGRPDRPGMAFQVRTCCAAGGIPDAHRAVVTGPHDLLPIRAVGGRQTEPVWPRGASTVPDRLHARGAPCHLPRRDN